MFRIDNSTAAASLPTPAAAGTPGYFTDGVPGTTAATVVPADWLNLVQEEIISAVTAAGISLSKTTRNQLLQAIQNLPTGRVLNAQIFTGVGTHTYTPTAGTNSVVVEVQAGGGPGCGTPSTGAGQTSHAGNGSSGSYAKKRITSGFSGVTVTVGAGGVGASGTSGTNGGASSFGSIVSAAGGICGNNQGATATTSYFVASPSAPATPTTGDVNVTGAVPGNNFTAAGMGIIQAGAQTMFGASYGAGGFGFPNTASSAALTGSNGQPGIVIVWEFS